MNNSAQRSARTTIRDIAARAEVSAMTVSRVLRGQGSGASSDTARRVLELAREMNYIAVRPALQNTHIATRVLGVVFDGGDSIKSFVGSHTFEGLRDEAMRRGFDLLLHASCASLQSSARSSAARSSAAQSSAAQSSAAQSSAAQSSAAQSSAEGSMQGLAPGSSGGSSGVAAGGSGRAWAQANDVLRREEAAFLDRRTDGVIFISPRERRAVLEALVAHGFPVVSCFSCDVPAGVATVAPDNARAMQHAVGYLQGRGHRRIAFFAGPDWHSDARERRAAWQAAMQEHELGACAEWVESSQGETARHIASARRLLTRRPTAVVCHNDYRALLLDEAARARGLELPRELSILGMDGLPEAGERGLSTLKLDFEAAGRAGVQAVLAMIEGASAQEVSQRLDATLIERRSVADIRSS